MWLWYARRGAFQLEAQILTDVQLYQMLESKIKAIRTLLVAAEQAMQKHPEKLRFQASNGYFGCMIEGRPHGIGRKTFNGSCFYESEWTNGHMNGAGACYWSAQKVRKGFFKEGKFDGLTVLISQGNTTCALWQDGKEVRPLPFTPPSLS